MEEEIERLRGELDALIKEYEDFEDQDIPDSLRVAVDQSWQMVHKQFDDNTLFAYSQESRQQHTTQCMTLSRALAVCASFEESLVEAMAVDPLHILWSKLGTKSKSALYVVSHLPDIWELIVNAWKSGSLIVFLLRESIQIMAIAELRQMVLKGLKVRQEWEPKLEKACLPQATGKRYWRKKRTRS